PEPRSDRGRAAEGAVKTSRINAKTPRRGRGAQAASRRTGQREDAALKSNEKVLVLVLITRQRRPLARIMPTQCSVDLQPAPDPLEEGGDVHERAERPRHEAPEDRGRVLDLVDGVGDQLVDAAGLEGGEVGHLGQVAARAGEVVEDGPELALEAG